MAIRKIVRIDESKCDGCGLCLVDCPEGALQLIDGKARLVRDSYCDGLGACLGACPQRAITLEQREAEDFDEQAVRRRMDQQGPQPQPLPLAPAGGDSCPGAAVRQMTGGSPGTNGGASQLRHWPVQLTLVPPGAPFLHHADLLLAADCAPFAMADFHSRLLQGRAVLVGCPKLDDPQSYVAKLADILQQAAPRSLTIVHMEVPCCTGLCGIAQMAMQRAAREVPTREVTLSVDGRVVDEHVWDATATGGGRP